jgi:hypothetical protein
MAADRLLVPDVLQQVAAAQHMLRAEQRESWVSSSTLAQVQHNKDR